MNPRGELFPEWGDRLRQIADAIESREADLSDAGTLRRIAAMLDGTHNAGSLKFHLPPHRSSEGSLGVMRKLEMSKAIKAFRDENRVSLENAFDSEELQKRFHCQRDTLRKAWKAMSPYFRIDEGARDVWLHMQKIAADHPGAVRIKRRGK